MFSECFLHVITVNCHLLFAMNFVLVSVVDAYESIPPGTVWSSDEPKSALSQTTLSTCDRLPEENGYVEDTTGSGNSAPPRKRLKRSPSSSPQNGVEKKLSNSMVVSAAAAILTQTAAVTPSLRRHCHFPAELSEQFGNRSSRSQPLRLSLQVAVSFSAIISPPYCR